MTLSGVWRSAAALRQRQTWVWLHRWIGLVMAIFLVVAGLTGSLLAFYDELDALIVPQFHELPAREGAVPMLDAVTLRERAVAATPGMVFASAWAPWRPDKPIDISFYPRADGPRAGGLSGKVYLDPYSGDILATRMNGDLRAGAAGVMPFIRRLHHSLAIGTIGTWTFGIVALLWTLSCFIGAYLTFPRGRPFFVKWRPSWWIKGQRFNYDLHRAGGLWTWAMLFVLAWSSVALNLPGLYYPATKAVLGFTQMEQSPVPAQSQPEPGMSWRDAWSRGEALMQEAIAQHGIGVHRVDAMHYDARRAEFSYWVATQFHNDGEARDWFGVMFNANTGELIRVDRENLPDEKAGDFVTRWLLDMHMAQVGGMPFRILVSVMGLVVTTLSISGVIIWWRRRRPARTGRELPSIGNTD